MTRKPQARRPLADRLWEKVAIGESDECWEWQAWRDRHGYGRIGLGGKHGRSVLAHRAAYELLVGPIPEGLELDHLCRDPPCVNPAHLEPVTHRENMLRGDTVGARNAAKTHCPQGHEYTPENTGPTVRGGRRCLACHREREGQRFAAQREAMNARRRERYAEGKAAA